jgi:predicted lipoprotein with Yx(FWY)xxD motif
VVVVALASGLGAPAAAGPSAVTVSRSSNIMLGTILVTAGGRTLYHYAADKGRVVACTGSCAVRWPPLLLTGQTKPIAGPGVFPSLLGTITRPDGHVQVTYRGLPLYRFSGDVQAGDVNGQGLGRTWHALRPSGLVVTTVVSGSSDGSTTATTGSTSSMGSGPSTGVNAGMWCAANPQSCVNGVPIGSH